MATRSNARGYSSDRPLVLGQHDGSQPIEVVANGVFQGLRTNDQRWVTGTAVDDGLAIGIIIPIESGTTSITETHTTTITTEITEPVLPPGDRADPGVQAMAVNEPAPGVDPDSAGLVPAADAPVTSANHPDHAARAEPVVGISDAEVERVLGGNLTEVYAYFEKYPQNVEQLKAAEAKGQARKGIASYELPSDD